MFAAREGASQAAYNTRPTAPEHLQMVTNLLGSGNFPDASNLNKALDDGGRRKLASHLLEVAKAPCHVCFQV